MIAVGVVAVAGGVGRRARRRRLGGRGPGGRGPGGRGGRGGRAARHQRQQRGAAARVAHQHAGHGPAHIRAVVSRHENEAVLSYALLFHNIFIGTILEVYRYKLALTATFALIDEREPRRRAAHRSLKVA